MRPERKPQMVCFWLPVSRSLADMTPAERVKLSRELGAPFTRYDAMGRERPCNCKKKFRKQPCSQHPAIVESEA